MQGDNLFAHLRHALALTCRHLEIGTPIRVASEIEGASNLRRQDRVVDLCARLGATTYLNPIGGLELYEPAAFERRGIALRFLRAKPFGYAQFGAPFVPWLSILDVLMFNPRSSLSSVLREGYDLIEGGERACPDGASSDGSSIPDRSAGGPG